MKPNIRIAPSLMAADFAQLGEQIRQLDALGVDIYHIDVMDGHFVPNLTMGPMVVEAIRRVTPAHLDVHLMVQEPERFIVPFAKAGANSISIHFEATPNVYRALQAIREVGCRAGIALNPHTPASSLREVIMLVDFINVMTVNPGFGGQAFIPSMASKIAPLRAMVGDLRQSIDIEVDGGISAETAQTVVQAGANILVAGSALFQHADGLAAGLKALQTAISED